MSLINLSIVSMLPSRSPNWKSCNIFNICKIYLLYVDDLINGAININFPSTEEGRYFARLSNFTPSIGEVDFVMERDIWRGIKAIRKESRRFRFPFSPFCFTLLNRESRKIGGIIVGGGKMGRRVPTIGRTKIKIAYLSVPFLIYL